MTRTPDFTNIQKVLERRCPDRPTLFEFFLNGPLYAKLAGLPLEDMGPWCSEQWNHNIVKAYAAAGYDYTTVMASSFGFPLGKAEHLKSVSQNEGALISDRASFHAYAWPDPDTFDSSWLERAGEWVPQGMKLIVWGPNGVLENAINLVGYENLCLMVMDDPQLAGDVFDAVGSRLLRYYEIASRYPIVGACISNDDWGYSQQTMLSPQDMRRFVFPWHRKIAQAIHAAGKFAILHSCGNLAGVMDDVIDDMKFDGKHSYEDKILPVEQAYEKWRGRIAVLGGIDVDFVCRSSNDAITQRSRAMLDRSQVHGGYALGTGNSVPEWLPMEKYFAMIEAAVGPLSL
jgi:uroporphyrinogen decarboxylase